MINKDKICSVDGCERESHCKSFCKMHYTRFVRHGDPLHTKYRDKCTVPGCGEKHLALGFCMKHHSRFKKYGNPLITKKRIRNKCNIIGCDIDVHKNGYCSYHSYRMDKYGDPLAEAHNSNIKHNMSHTSEYRVWSDMLTRCVNKNHNSYHRYGGRGIAVCDRWRSSFMAFYEDMGPKPFKKAQIDRIDNDGNYEPGNCRWVAPSVNTHNSSQSKITFDIANKIREMYETGEYSQYEIGNMFGIHSSTVSCVITNRTWYKE